MPHTTAEQLLASRPRGAAVAALFSSGPEPILVLRQPVAARPARPRPDAARSVWARLGLMLMRHVPCEDITFAAQPLRRSRQT